MLYKVTPTPPPPLPLGKGVAAVGGMRRSRVGDAHRGVLVEGVHGGQEGEDDSVALVVPKTEEHNLGHVTSHNVTKSHGESRHVRSGHATQRLDMSIKVNHVTSVKTRQVRSVQIKSCHVRSRNVNVSIRHDTSRHATS